MQSYVIDILKNKETMAGMYDRYTTAEIGEGIGCSAETVRRALMRHRIPLRKKGHRSVQDHIERSVIKIKSELRKWPQETQGEIIKAVVGNNAGKRSLQS